MTKIKLNKDSIIYAVNVLDNSIEKIILDNYDFSDKSPIKAFNIIVLLPSDIVNNDKSNHFLKPVYNNDFKLLRTEIIDNIIFFTDNTKALEFINNNKLNGKIKREYLICKELATLALEKLNTLNKLSDNNIEIDLSKDEIFKILDETRNKFNSIFDAM